MWYMNEERELMRNAARDFAQNELAPVAAELGKDEKFPMEQFKRAGELGLLGITFPEKFGGLGADHTTLALVYEEIAKVAPGLTVNMSAHSILCGEMIMLLCDDDIKERYLRPAATGEKILACAETEAVGGGDQAEYTSTAILDGDEYVLNGSKVLISNIGVADAYIFIAKTGTSVDPKDLGGMGAFIVDAGTEGLTIGSYEKKFGWHGSATGTVTCNNVRVPKENMLGKPGAGMTGFMTAAANEFMTCGPIDLGLAEHCYEVAYEYASQRIQHGKPMIDDYEVLRHKLVHMKTKIEMLRGATYSTFADKDAGKMCLANARMLKVVGSKWATEIASDAIQVFGGVGVIDDTDLARYWHDARIGQIGGGCSDTLNEEISQIIRNGMEDL